MFLDRDGAINRTVVRKGIYTPSRLAEFEILSGVSIAQNWDLYAASGATIEPCPAV